MYELRLRSHKYSKGYELACEWCAIINYGSWISGISGTCKWHMQVAYASGTTFPVSTAMSVAWPTLNHNSTVSSKII